MRRAKQASTALSCRARLIRRISPERGRPHRQKNELGKMTVLPSSHLRSLCLSLQRPSPNHQSPKNSQSSRSFTIIRLARLFLFCNCMITTSLAVSHPSLVTFHGKENLARCNRHFQIRFGRSNPPEIYAIGVLTFQFLSAMPNLVIDGHAAVCSALKRRS